MLGGAVARADVDPPVCVACGCCPRGLGRATPTYHPFRFPIGLDHYRKLPCAPPRELGAVQASALQQAEEIEAVLAEMAELRAENVRLAEGAIVKKAKGGGPKLAEALADPPEEEAHAEVD